MSLSMPKARLPILPTTLQNTVYAEEHIHVYVLIYGWAAYMFPGYQGGTTQRVTMQLSCTSHFWPILMFNVPEMGKDLWEM